MASVGGQRLGRLWTAGLLPSSSEGPQEQFAPSPGSPATAERRAMEDYQVLEGNTTPARLASTHRLHSGLPSPPIGSTDACNRRRSQAPTQLRWRNHFCRTGRSGLGNQHKLADYFAPHRCQTGTDAHLDRAFITSRVTFMIYSTLCCDCSNLGSNPSHGTIVSLAHPSILLSYPLHPTPS